MAAWRGGRESFALAMASWQGDFPPQHCWSLLPSLKPRLKQRQPHASKSSSPVLPLGPTGTQRVGRQHMRRALWGRWLLQRDGQPAPPLPCVHQPSPTAHLQLLLSPLAKSPALDRTIPHKEGLKAATLHHLASLLSAVNPWGS